MKTTLPMQNKVKAQVSAMLVGALMGGLSWSSNTHAAPQLQEAKELAAECASMLQRSHLRRAFHLASTHIQSQGLRLKLQGCPFVHTGRGQMQQVLDVRVWVVDSDVAVNFVRGPLADGEEVDMGDVQLTLNDVSQGAAHEAAQDVSPDVLFNRDWLARIMAMQGLQGVAGHWWAFVPVSSRSS